MRPYTIPKGKRRGKSKRASIDSSMVKMLSKLAVFAIGVTLAGMFALKLYLISLWEMIK